MKNDQNLHFKLNEVKDTVQDCNINFLLGSGASSPYLSMLGNVEKLLKELAESNVSEEHQKIIRASIYKSLYDGAIKKNLDILAANAAADANLKNYKDILKTLNYILLKRKSTILSKQINLFTTNYDIFLEKALDDTGLEYNDGFNGRFSPKFGLSNFKKSQFKKSLHYENTSEMPVFNLLKLHGSLTWIIDSAGGDIHFSSDLALLKKINKITIPATALIEVKADSEIADLETAAAAATFDTAIDTFNASYDKLAIVNPNKEKFKTTLLNHTYYELLRIYSNELEKENTVLFVAGFSFADEHILEVTIRAANSNPTLIIYIFAYSDNARATLEAAIDKDSVKNSNIKILAPLQKKNDDGTFEDEWKYDLPTINDMIFDKLLTPENKVTKDIEPETDPLEA
jgi:SIR2-like domain